MELVVVQHISKARLWTSALCGGVEDATVIAHGIATGSFGRAGVLVRRKKRGGIEVNGVCLFILYGVLIGRGRSLS